MNITTKLNLNKHPKDCLNLSLVNAQNVKISNDESCITSEDSTIENIFILNYLDNYYGEVSHRIVGIIACNNELVLIVKPGDTDTDADIFRYQEPINDNTEQMYCAYGGIGSINRFKYQGGKIKGAFTYNVENSIVVAITEYGVPNVKIPLRTINLGNFNNPDIYNDKDLSDSKLSMSPEVRLPSVTNLDYIAGSAYKGWYYMFIRYKINTIDYTQWYSIGIPIYIDTLEQFQIVRYCYNRDTKFASNSLNDLVNPPNPNEGYGAGCSDYFSNTSDIAKETFKVNLNFNMAIDYTKYQIGVVCASKSYTKAFRTSDIYLDRNYTGTIDFRIQQYILDNKSLIEYNITSLITDNFNYFNIKNIWNYQNRLYIGNYLEDNANNKDIDQSIIDNISVNLTSGGIADFGLVYDTALIARESNNGVSQYDTYGMSTIPMYKYLNVSEDTIITVESAGSVTKTNRAGQFYIVCGDTIPAFAYVELREPGSVGSVITTTYGKAPNQGVVAINMGDTIDNNINTLNTAMDGGMQYINTNISFKERKAGSTLIPGEIYNLFIHFVSKYGHATNGYRLSNSIIWDTEDNVGVEIIPVSFNIKVGSTVLSYYAALEVDSNVITYDYFNSKYVVNTDNIKFYKSYGVTTLMNKVSSGEEADCMTAFIDNFYSYTNDKFLNVKWYQISYGPGENHFHLFINNNGDRLFKVPLVESFDLGIIGFPGEVEDYKLYCLHKLLKLYIDNVVIPDDYEGFYISYEKFESQRRVTGVLTRNDFRSQDYVSNGSNSKLLTTGNDKKSNKMFFYTSGYDVSDTIKLDYNIMRFEGVNVFKKNDIPEWDYFQRNDGFGFVHDQNKPQVTSYGDGTNRTYSMPEYKIAVADSAVDNRMGLGTALQIEDSYNLFLNYDPNSGNNNKIKLYRVTLLNTTRDIYMSNTKTLIKLTDVIYKNGFSETYNTYINDGFNGRYTYDGVIVYENAGVQFNTTTNKVTTFNGELEYYKSSVDAATPHTYQNDYPFLAYMQFPICMDVFLESKSFKSAPKGIIYVTKKVGDTNIFTKGSMVTPVDSIDLFENKQGSADDFNPKTYSNYIEDLVSIEQFDKTVRRSNVIQDETRINGWRTFPIEGYKNISENKGKITNIIGVGYILLVHTEHSLFMFNNDNTFKAQDNKSIQLSQPDIFETNYKEVFTSDKGYGGLQDDKSFLLDDFGYIFHSVDTNRIYLFDAGELNHIDDDIIQWLGKYTPFNVRMANDKKNYRILMKFDYIVGGVQNHTVLSYNYKAKSFVSQHTYYFDDAYSTKTNLYMLYNEGGNFRSLYMFDHNAEIYCSFINVLGSMDVPTIQSSKISIICNNNYDIVKFIEFITYKLTKYVNDVAIDFTNSPVEEYIEPFAGNTVVLYNNEVSTGVLDINVNNEISKNIFANFDKPYWDKGVWNFSYIRNRISERPSGMTSDLMTRVFGNYFIIEFVFDNTDGHRIDFEELNYNLSEN